MKADVYASMALPDPMRGAGRLFLWPNDPGTARELEAVALRLGRRLDKFERDGCVALHTDERDAVLILDTLRRYLDAHALTRTRAVFKVGMGTPSLADFPRANSLDTFVGYARGKWLGEMIDSRRLTAWFQPIVNAQNPEKVEAWEALARGRSHNSSVAEVVLPCRLISAAKDAGMLATFDRHIHQQALEAFDLPDGAMHGLFLNVTTSTLENPEFCLTQLHHACLQADLQPSRITLEIIESETIISLDRVQDILTIARALGFGLALDDLGAGYSNLNLIHQLRPDIVKLDMALVRNIHTDPYKAVLAQKILEATHSLGVHTVAEGVECEEELEWLAAHDVNFVQGYFIARPTPSPRLLPLPTFV
ncbi:MAG: EAL domain-containing protein [Myxococcales bacterium]|nr:EAL domain-containing protein [Myxococcales bacterium]